MAYRSHTTWTAPKPWRIIAVKEGTLKCYLGQINLKGGEWDLLTTLKEDFSISSDSLRVILKTFHDNGIFSMRSTQHWMDSCSNQTPSCGDCKEYDFVILTPDKVKRLFFYEPELYAPFCPVVAENKNIINIIKTVFSQEQVEKKTKPKK